MIDSPLPHRVRALSSVVSAMVLIAAAACSGSGSSDADLALIVGDSKVAAALAGTWGGEHLQLVSQDTIATLEYDCAAGTMRTPRRIGIDGRFTTTGTHVLMHGGPVREGEPEDIHPASYTGELHGDSMILEVRLSDTGQSMGSFTLRRGRPGSVFRCL